MNRAPHPGWRRLYAVGGTPAVSYATLSRPPATDRLLEPLARVGLAHDTSLDVLARPLDVSEVLARVVTATYAGDGAPPHPEVVPTPVTSNRGSVATTEIKPSRGRAAASALPGPTSGAARVHLAEPVRADTGPLRSGAAPRVTREPVERRREPFDAPEVPGHARPRMGATAAVRSLPRRDLAPEASAGATARVLVDSPLPDVERLLALGDPAQRESCGLRGSAHSAPSMSERSGSEAAGLLAGAVERAGVRGASSAVRLDVRHFAPPEVATTTTETRLDRRDIVFAPDPESGGGFRGLARRALGATDGERHFAVPLEREPRTASEVPLDSLDSRVAESLARILEREARRHGLDLTEVRP